MALLKFPISIISTTIVALALAAAPTSQHASLALRPQNQPPVFVIQPESYIKNLGHSQVPDKHHIARQWDNQKLIQRQDNREETRPTIGSARTAKQLFYSDEPMPFYHTYKYMGYGAVPMSNYQPLRSYSSQQDAAWYSRRVGLEQPDDDSIGAENLDQESPLAMRQSAGTKGSTGKGSSSKGVGSPRRTFRPPVAGQPPISRGPPVEVPDSQKPINRANHNNRKNLVCYYGTWAVYRPDAGKYPVENIDPFLCTHVIYGFTGLSYDNLIKPLDPWNDLEDNYGKGAMRRFTNLKRANPDLKTLVAIGGWNEGSIKYSKMASEPESRAKFVQSVVEFLQKYNFDGLDLDWEYPGARGGHSYDKQNFVRLLKELKEAFKPHGYLLTAAVSAGKWFIEPAYDIPQVNKYLDLINLMAYDYHGGWETKTGMNAPLFHSLKHDLSREDQMLNVNWSVNYWLQQGASPEKLMLGVGSYGRSFTLDKSDQNGLNAAASQKGQAGPYTREPGSLGYNEICELFQRQPQSWTIVRDADYLAPYAYNRERQWVGYDDPESLTLKAMYAKSMGLGGMMMWSIETDDFQGKCHNEKYPLLNTIRRVIDEDRQVRPPRPAGTGTTSRRPDVEPSTSRPATSHTQRPTRKPAPSSTTPGREVEDEARPSPPPPQPASSTSRPRPSQSTARPTTSTRRPPASSSTTTTSTRRPPPSSAEFACRQDGMFADPRNCRKFVRCVGSGSGNFAIYKFDCGPGTAFNEQQGYCDHLYNVPSCRQQQERNALHHQRRGSYDDRQLGNYQFSIVHRQQLQPQSQLLGYWRPY